MLIVRPQLNTPSFKERIFAVDWAAKAAQWAQHQAAVKAAAAPPPPPPPTFQDTVENEMEMEMEDAMPAHPNHPDEW